MELCYYLCGKETGHFMLLSAMGRFCELRVYVFILGFRNVCFSSIGFSKKKADMLKSTVFFLSICESKQWSLPSSIPPYVWEVVITYLFRVRGANWMRFSHSFKAEQLAKCAKINLHVVDGKAQGISECKRCQPWKQTEALCPHTLFLWYPGGKTGSEEQLRRKAKWQDLQKCQEPACWQSSPYYSTCSTFCSVHHLTFIDYTMAILIPPIF